MYIKNLQLMNFTNYDELNIELCSGVNIFIGDNAQGKTNILESLYYCSLAKSHRTNKDKELIKWDKQESYVKAYISKERIDKNIEIKIFSDGKKGIKVNSIKINKISELMGVFNTVMFSPEDLKIVKDAPSYRRKFLDIELCKLSGKYYYNLVQYNKVLNERNSVLKKHMENCSDILDIYDEQLSKFGAAIVKERLKYIEKLNEKGKLIHNEITSGKENIEFKYINTLRKNDLLEKELLSMLIQNRRRDLEKKTTSIGPHRDDFSIEINGIDTRDFGSQGQQRTSVLTIKFASLYIIKEDTGEYPVLLLDDVLSELDFNRQVYILSAINNVQTVITCTGIENIKSYLGHNTKLYSVNNGKVELV